MGECERIFYRIIYDKGHGVKFEDFNSREEMLLNSRCFAEEIISIRKFKGERATAIGTVSRDVTYKYLGFFEHKEK